MKYLNSSVCSAVLVMAMMFGASSPVHAQQSQQSMKHASPPQGTLYAAGNAGKSATGGAAEDVDVGKIKERYWNKGDETEVNVVQNRLYSKAHRLEVGLFGSSIVTDPFLTVWGTGASIGYHFTEYVGLNVYGWKDFVSTSGAFDVLQNRTSVTVNPNKPNYFVGSELQASVLYGKLSLVGKSIIYYDMHFLLGAGVTSTVNGTYFTPTIGIGQQIYLTDFMSLNLNFRLTPYQEDIVDHGEFADPGADKRINWTNALSLGLSFLL